ncbi:hypothetical protein ACFL0L_01350 [Patescibacteria group bacterium]
MQRTEKILVCIAALLMLLSSPPASSRVQVPTNLSTGAALEPQSDATATALTDTTPMAVLKMSDGGPAFTQKTISRSSEYGCEKAEMVCDISPLDLNVCLSASISVSGISLEEGWEPAIIMSNCVCYRQCDELTLHVWTMNGLDTLFRCCDTSGAVISAEVPVGSLIHFRRIGNSDWMGTQHYVMVLDQTSCICEDCVERSYFNRTQ